MNGQVAGAATERSLVGAPDQAGGDDQKPRGKDAQDDPDRDPEGQDLPGTPLGPDQVEAGTGEPRRHAGARGVGDDARRPAQPLRHEGGGRQRQVLDHEDRARNTDAEEPPSGDLDERQQGHGEEDGD